MNRRAAGQLLIKIGFSEIRLEQGEHLPGKPHEADAVLIPFHDGLGEHQLRLIGCVKSGLDRNRQIDVGGRTIESDIVLIGDFINKAAFHQIIQRQRPTEQEALHEIDAPLPRVPELVRVLHSLRDHQASGPVAHVHDGTNDDRGFSVVP